MESRMNIERLAEKQKRIKNVQNFLRDEVTVDPLLRSRIEKTLEEFQKGLSIVWRSKSEADWNLLADCERRLEALSEEARLIVHPRASRAR